MSEVAKYNLYRDASDLDISDFKTYSRVTIMLADTEDEEGKTVEQSVSVGSDTGEELIIDMPQCSSIETARTAATNILSGLKGFSYQPYSASNAFLDPAAEPGDAVSINDVYTGVYNRNFEFSPHMALNLDAPQEEEVDHEFTYVSSTERQYKRELADLSSKFRITAGEIRGEVSQVSDNLNSLSSVVSQQPGQILAQVVTKTGGSNSTFAWKLDASGFKLTSNNRTVFSVGTDGTATFSGDVYARNMFLSSKLYFGSDTSATSMDSATVSNLLSEVNKSSGGWSSAASGFSGLTSGQTIVDWLKTKSLLVTSSFNVGNGGTTASSVGVYASTMTLYSSGNLYLGIKGSSKAVSWNSKTVLTSASAGITTGYGNYRVALYNASGVLQGYNTLSSLIKSNSSTTTIYYLGY